MTIPLILLISGAIAVIMTIIFIVFGYKLARFVTPLCGVIVIEFILYLFVYDLLGITEGAMWLFTCGTAVVVYVLLFMMRRPSVFFVGILGMGLLLLSIIYAFGMHEVPYLYVGFFAISGVAGLLAAAYRRMGVIIATSLFGGCATALIGLYLIISGIFAVQPAAGATMVSQVDAFLRSNGLLVLGVSVALTVAGVLLQHFSTGKTQLLDVSEEDRAIMKRNKKRTDDDTWVGGGKRSKKGANV